MIYVRNFNIILSRALRQENIYCNNYTRIINNNAPAAQAAPAASVIHRIAASGIDLPPLLPFLIWATSGDWLKEAEMQGVVLT